MSDGIVRTLGWRDGLVLSFTMPAALVATVGYSVSSIGTWGAVLLWAVSMLIASLANLAYAELASMFPDKPGGIALYAAEAWRSRLAFVGPVASMGYWFAWSSSIAVFANVAGGLIRAEWFAGQTWSAEAGPLTFTFDLVVAAGIVAVVWGANILGIVPTMRVAYAAAGLLLVPLSLFMVVTFATGTWSAETLTWRLGEAGQEWGGLKLALVWLYVMLWTALGVEVCATFTPEYRRGSRDAALALRVAALVSLGVFVLLPLGAAGSAGEPAVTADPLTFYVVAFEEIVGGAAGLMVALIVAGLVLVLITSLADSSRVLYGMAREGIIPRGVDRLNARGVPGRAMTVDLVLTLALLFAVGNTLAILATGNLGYLLSHVFALTGLLLLRRDRPGWSRPVRLRPPLVVATGALALALTVILLVGAVSFDLTGYGGRKELVIALGILLSAVVLYAFRQVVQERAPLRLRDRTERVDASDLPV
jgi:amino acid transporter